jgi:hypothetical protein
MTEKPEGNPIAHLGRIIPTETRTKATPLEAYVAWADPEKIAHWFPDRAERQGRARRDHHLDLRQVPHSL